MLTCDNREKGFDDLQLNSFIGLWSGKALTNGFHDSDNKQFALMRGIGDVSS